MKKSFNEFTTQLVGGQLKNVNIVNDASLGLIYPEYKEQILKLTNQGLIDITTRKKLQENLISLTFQPNQNIYILDTNLDPFYEYLVRVLSVTVLDGRVFIPKTTSVITMVNQNTIRFSDSFIEQYGPSVDILFQTHHAPITIDGEMDLPAHLYEALILYVSGLYLSHMGGEEHTAKGDSYYGLYLRMLGDDEMQNLSGTSEVNDEDIRFYDRGFV